MQSGGENDDCDEEMNFTPFSCASGMSNFVTNTSGQFQSASAGKIQQSVTPNGQVISMVNGDNGIQYVRAIDASAQIAAPAQVLTIPITVPGAKPGDPPQTVQIQVLNPNVLQQNVQTPKYQMQIPIQGFQHGNAYLTLAYAPDNLEGVQLVGNSAAEGLQLLSIPNDGQDSAGKNQHGQEQDFIIETNIHQNAENEIILDNNNCIKQEYEDKDEESVDYNMSDNTNSTPTNQQDQNSWQNDQAQIAEYINKMPDQRSLPVTLQQFLKFNPDVKREEGEKTHEIEIDPDEIDTEKKKPKKKKYRRPPKPPKPKPGQVTIARAVDGTTIFCCPECHMAYPDKEQLEQHLLVGHRIERRFICGICGAGLKRKEHLERHKMGHNPERPYVCQVCLKGFKRKEHLNLHTVIHSGEKREICQECGKGFYRKDHLRKHTRAHLNRRVKDELITLASMNGATNTTSTITASKTNAATQPSISMETTSNEVKTSNLIPDITIHVPTSNNVQVPVHISVPQHIITLAQSTESHNHNS